eukprot:2036686-Amphidinium_carterae.1
MLTDLPIKRIVLGQKLGSLMTILTVEKVAVKPHLPDGDTPQVPPRLLVPVLAHMLEHLGGSTMACRVMLQSDASAGGGANGKERVVQTPEEIDDGFRYVQVLQDAGPTNPSDALPWALKQQMFGNGESGDGPLVGWNLGWINKDGLAAKRDAGFVSKEVVDYPLTLMDFLVGDLGWNFRRGVGKTPAAHALSNAMGHFWRTEMGLEGHASFKSAMTQHATWSSSSAMWVK